VVASESVKGTVFHTEGENTFADAVFHDEVEGEIKAVNAATMFIDIGAINDALLAIENTKGPDFWSSAQKGNVLKATVREVKHIACT